MAVAFSDSASALGRYAAQEGLGWVFGEGPASINRDYNIRSQSSYVGIGRDGTIVASSGGGSGKNWTNILDTLQSSS